MGELAPDTTTWRDLEESVGGPLVRVLPRDGETDPLSHALSDLDAGIAVDEHGHLITDARVDTVTAVLAAGDGKHRVEFTKLTIKDGRVGVWVLDKGARMPLEQWRSDERNPYPGRTRSG